MDDDELVTMRGAGKLLQLANLSQFKATYTATPFPEPVVTVNSRIMLWRLGDIRTWYAAAVQTPRPTRRKQESSDA